MHNGYTTHGQLGQHPLQATVANQPQTTSILSDVLHEQQQVIDQLWILAGNMRDRLYPVLSPAPPEAVGAAQVPEPPTTVSQNVRFNNGRLAALGSNLNELLSRLEV